MTLCIFFPKYFLDKIYTTYIVKSVKQVFYIKIKKHKIPQQ